MAKQPDVSELLKRPVLTTFSNYKDAQGAVDKLSEAQFPVEAVTIVGVDLRMVESILGRTSWARAAMGGLAMFAWLGVLIGLFVSFFGNQDASPLTYVFLGLLYGAGFGIVFGLGSYAISGRRHEFVSRSGVQASSFDLLCVDAELHRAKRILGLAPKWPPESPTRPDSQERPDGT